MAKPNSTDNPSKDTRRGSGYDREGSKPPALGDPDRRTDGKTGNVKPTEGHTN